MTRDAIATGVVECVMRVKPGLDRASLRPDRAFGDLGLTSLEVLSVVFEIEEMFSVSLVETGLDGFRTIDEGVEVLSQLVAERA